MSESDFIRSRLYIDGEWRRPHGSVMQETVDAATGECIGRFPEADRRDVDYAVTGADRALRDRAGWGGMDVSARTAIMRRLANAIESRTDVLGRLIAHEVGTPLTRAETNNVGAAASLLRYYADVVESQQVEDVRSAQVGHSIVRREPIGVTAMVLPWNYPLSTMFFKLAPALAAGCTAVVKPATTTGLDSFFIADALEEVGFPAGVVSFVPAGREIGEYLVTHPGVAKVAFTGSTAAGKRIGGLCGERLKPVTLELGGKSAAILLEDAPLDLFLEHLHELCFANNGQTCTNNTRILAPASRYAEVVDAVTTEVDRWLIGDPLDPDTQVGPLCSEVQRDRVEEFYRVGVAEGARLTTGGGRPAEPSGGFFVQPTVFADATTSMRIFREEIFGPAVAITQYSGDPADGVALANDSDYGLSGAVFTASEADGVQVARGIESGTVNVNLSNFDIGAPFGGRKDSGVGSELGAEGIHAYQHLKSMFVPNIPPDVCNASR